MNAKGLTPILNVSDLQESFSWFDGHVFRIGRGTDAA